MFFISIHVMQTYCVCANLFFLRLFCTDQTLSWPRCVEINNKQIDPWPVVIGTGRENWESCTVLFQFPGLESHQI